MKKDDGTIDDKAVMDRREALQKLGKFGAGVAALFYGGCVFDPRGLDSPDIHGVDAGTGVNPDVDHPENDGGVADGGDCSYSNADLPTRIFNTMDWPENLEDQRVYEGGLTIGEIIESALDSATAYEAVDFRHLYDNSEFRTALYNDLENTISEKICSDSEQDIAAAFNETFHQIFDDGNSDKVFNLNDNDGETAVYFAKAVGNDGEERTYLLMFGALQSRDGNQTAEPKVLYAVPVNNAFEYLRVLEQEGI